MKINEDPGADGFTSEIERVLEHFADAEWLGNHSPLAAPYFLGNTLDDSIRRNIPVLWGNALQNIIRSAANQLSQSQHDLLRFTYFGRRPDIGDVGVAAEHALHLSRRSFFRHRAKAVRDLAQAVSDLVLPPLRPEQPLRKVIVGRSDTVNDCLDVLRGRHAVAITGASGTGKTSLGSEISHCWGMENTFWFTLRPGLNDHLSAFAFALSYFLRLRGLANTWLQLVADKGSLKPERFLGLIRYDFAHSTGALLLLCVDEVDLLHSDSADHAQIIHILEELRGLTPLLLVGQRLAVEVDRHVGLSGLDRANTSEMLFHLGMPHLPEDLLDRLYSTTRGNPALLTLYATLYRVSGFIDDVLNAISSAPSTEVLLSRIWRHLRDDERIMLMMLSVFRSPAPLDAWSEQQDTIRRLTQLELAQADGNGGIHISQHLRQLVYERIPSEMKSTLHLKAAIIRETRGEYTPALFHYVMAKQPSAGIWNWFEHRSTEIDRGHGTAAQAVLKTITDDELPDERDRDILHVTRASLLQLLGKTEEAEHELSEDAFSSSELIRVFKLQMQGDILQATNRLEQSVERYRNAIDLLVDSPQYRHVMLHTKLSHIYETRLINLDMAFTQALRAKVEADTFLGSVLERSGDYASAHTHYQTALDAAQKLEDSLLYKSRIYSHLGNLSWKQGDLEAALSLLEKAIALDEARGDIVSPLYDRISLSAVHIMAGRYEDALREAESGLSLARSLNHAELIAGLASNAGEACYYLNRLDESEQFAWLSLQQEEEAIRPYTLAVLGLVRHAQGRYGEAESALQESCRTAQENGERYAEAAAWRSLGQVLQAQHKISAARDACETALRLYTDLGLAKEIGQLRQALDALTLPAPAAV